MTFTNSGTLGAYGGELDITSEPVINTATLQAIGSGILKLTTTTVTNTDGTTSGTVTVGSASALDLISATIADGSAINHGGAQFEPAPARFTIDGITNSNIIEFYRRRPDHQFHWRRDADQFRHAGANGGEFDITSGPVTNTGTLQATDNSISEADDYNGNQHRRHHQRNGVG